MRLKTFVLATSAIVISVVGFLLVAEVVLWFLPVSTGLKMQAVNSDNPIPRYEPNRNFIFSDEWNFAIVNRGRINNAGFVNDQDYRKDDSRPLLAVIGDSYVEAKMVPYRSTLHGLLQGQLGELARVYSFGLSGAPLSHYLAFAQYAKEEYNAHFMLFNVVGNDYDESLRKYNPARGIYTYVPDGDVFKLNVREYQPGPIRSLLRQSALVRYLFFNLEAWRAYSKLRGYFSRREAARYVGNTLARTSEERLADATAGITAFFRDLPGYSGLPPECILFLVDGVLDMIYVGKDDQTLEESFVNVMRDRFVRIARDAGYEVMDLHPRFAEHFERHGQRFEFATDGHWNGLGHEVAAQAVQASDAFQRFVRAVSGDAVSSAQSTC